ncbi:helix-turn-helix transcriptional regulator [Micromonospora sp. WMMD1274]|uniref:helix-turn-helix transcriptional regulator n=1 Tax=Micromonospora sp. WMMD1274 TaxID=3404116 RepID=UPI003B93BA4D
MSTTVLADDTDYPTTGRASEADAATTRPLLDDLRRSIAASQQDLRRAQRQLTEAHADLEGWTHRLVREAGAGVPAETVPDATEFHRLSARLCARDGTGCRLLHGGTTGAQAHEHPVPRPGDTAHRSVLARARLEQPAFRQAVEEAARSTHRHRVLPHLTITLQLADGVTLLSLPQPDGPSGLLLRHPELVRLATQFFEAAWIDGLPMEARESTGDDRPSEVQLQILRLAAVGAKDDSIARSLGRSTRWVRRHFELLEEQLGATNRMSLGIAAVRRGWI